MGFLEIYYFQYYLAYILLFLFFLLHQLVLENTFDLLASDIFYALPLLFLYFSLFSPIAFNYIYCIFIQLPLFEYF